MFRIWAFLRRLGFRRQVRPMPTFQAVSTFGKDLGRGKTAREAYPPEDDAAQSAAATRQPK
jgi:hypothetical protein